MWLMFCISSGSGTISGTLASDEPYQILYLYSSDSSIPIPLKILESSNTWIIEDEDITIADITHISTWNLRIKNGTLTLRNAELAMKPVLHWDINITIEDNGALVLENSSISTTKRMALVMHENASLDASNSTISVTVLDGDSTGKFIFINSSFDNSDAECNGTGNPTKRIHTNITGNNITIAKSTIYSDRKLEIRGTGNEQNIEISDTNITAYAARTGEYPWNGALVLNGSNVSLSNTSLSSNILFIYGNSSRVLNLSRSKMDIGGDIVIGDNQGYFEKIQINDTKIKNHADDITIYCKGTLDSNNSLFSAFDYINFTNDKGSINISNSELTSEKRNVNISSENGSINISKSELTSEERNINLFSHSMVVQDSQLNAEIYSPPPPFGGYRIYVSGDVELINTTISGIYSPFNGFNCEYTHIKIANESTANASWYVDVVVKDANGRFVRGANITLYNRINQSYSKTSGTTDERGYARLVALTETMTPPYYTHFVGNLNLSVLYDGQKIEQQILVQKSIERRIALRTVILHDKPIYDDFDGAQINESIWYSKTFGSCTVNNSILNVPSENDLHSIYTFQYPTVEMKLKLSSAPATNITQIWGLWDEANWVDFSSQDGQFRVRSYNSSSEIEKVNAFTTFNLTEWHTYKIIRTPDANRFYIDDEYIARHNIELSSANMFLRFYSFGDNLSVDWINVSVDTSPPNFTYQYPLDDSSIADNMTGVYANYSDEWSGVCAPALTITLDGVDVKKKANITSSSVSYKPQEPFNDGIHLVNVTVSDNQGNFNFTNWSFIVDAHAPTITIISPINDTTYNNSSINLNYSVNEETMWEGYSLDGAANVTLTGNTTLANLTGGMHNVIVYANDTAGKMNSSIVWFTVVTSESITFDTGAGTYPSIMGIHKGNFTPSNDLTVNRMYTYPCAGTGGHSEYVKFRNDTWSVEANWTGYEGDWHYIIFNASFSLKANETYNYIICTGSYPQIIHKQTHTMLDGSVITCTEFEDANGKVYENWIPAIRLE